MYLVGWFVVGFILAGYAMYLGRQKRPDLLGRMLAAELLLLTAPPIDDEVAPAQQVAPGNNYWSARLWFGGLAIVSLLLLWFAAASDRAGLWNWVLWLRSPFLGARFEYLLWGAAFGVFTQLFRDLDRGSDATSVRCNARKRAGHGLGPAEHPRASDHRGRGVRDQT